MPLKISQPCSTLLKIIKHILAICYEMLGGGGIFTHFESFHLQFNVFDYNAILFSWDLIISHLAWADYRLPQGHMYQPHLFFSSLFCLQLCHSIHNQSPIPHHSSSLHPTTFPILPCDTARTCSPPSWFIMWLTVVMTPLDLPWRK